MPAESSPPRSFLHASLLLFACSNAANLFQFVFQALMRRELPGGDFSLMNSAFSTVALLALPTAIWNQVWVRKFSEFRARGNTGAAFDCVRRFSIYALIAAAAVLAAALAATPAFKGFLNTTNTAAVVALACLLGATIAFPMANVVLQGMQLFGVLSILAMLMPAVRLGLGFALLRQDLGASAGIWATLAASLIPGAAALSIVLHRGWFSLPHDPRAPASPWRAPDVWVPAAGIVITTVLVNTDFVLVQRFFRQSEADRFATAAIFGHSMIFFLMPIASVLLPKVVDHFEGWERAERSVARKAMALGLALAIAMAVAGTALAPVALRLFAGNSDPHTVSLIRLFLWAIIPTSLACIGINALVGRMQQRLLLACLAIALGLPALILWRHESLEQILGAHFAVGAALLAVTVGGNLTRARAAGR